MYMPRVPLCRERYSVGLNSAATSLRICVSGSLKGRLPGFVWAIEEVLDHSPPQFL